MKYTHVISLPENRSLLHTSPIPLILVFFSPFSIYSHNFHSSLCHISFDAFGRNLFCSIKKLHANNQ